MSQAKGSQNVQKLETWIDLKKSEGWASFESAEYNKKLSRGKVSKQSGVDLNALKTDKGNSTILAMLDALEKELQIHLPNVFQATLSALEKYRNHITALEERGEGFPVDKNDNLNFNRLAKDIGIRVQQLDSPTIKQEMKGDIERLGTTVIKGKTVEERQEEGLIATSKELSTAKTDLAIAEQQVEALRKQVRDLQRENRTLKLKLEEGQEGLDFTIESGRRFDGKF